jgi:hypothetical protein
VFRQLPVITKRGPKQQRTDAIALLLSRLPHAQVLESIYTHASLPSMTSARTKDPGPRTQDPGRTKDQERTQNQAPSTKDRCILCPFERNTMAITRQTMTDEQRKSVALEYLKAFDNKGVTSNGGSILDLFADDAQVFFPKWGLATGKKQIGQLFTDFGGGIKSILHDYYTFNWIMTGTDVFAVEGTSAGEYKDGPWRAGVSHAGRWCDVFEVRDFLIQRCFIYLDPDYAGLDTARYQWLSAGGRDPSKPMG